jgi:hypothetical protein
MMSALAPIPEMEHAIPVLNAQTKMGQVQGLARMDLAFAVHF